MAWTTLTSFLPLRPPPLGQHQPLDTGNEREQSEPRGRNVQDRCRARVPRKTRFTSPDLPLHRNVVQLIEIKKHDCGSGTLLCISLRYLAKYKSRFYLSRLAVSAPIRPQIQPENTIYRLQESKYCAWDLRQSISLPGNLFSSWNWKSGCTKRSTHEGFNVLAMACFWQLYMVLALML